MEQKNKAGDPGANTEIADRSSLPGVEQVDTTNTSPEQALSPPDIFQDLGAFTVDMDAATPSERVLVTLPVRRPKETEWVRAHPEIRCRLNLVTDKEGGSVYLIHSSLLDEVRDLITVRPVMLALAVTATGTPLAWPAPIPADHRVNLWHSTGLQAMEHATRAWVRVRADMSGGQYEIRRRVVDDGTAPTWPAEIATANDLCRFAFNGRGGGTVITDRDDSLLKRLRGEL